MNNEETIVNGALKSNHRLPTLLNSSEISFICEFSAKGCYHSH